jgi:hypothetical protein
MTYRVGAHHNDGRIVMSKKKHPPGPIPPGNRSNVGPQATPDEEQDNKNPPEDGTGFNEEDPKRRLGDFTGAGEHSIQQPGGKQAGA